MHPMFEVGMTRIIEEQLVEDGVMGVPLQLVGWMWIGDGSHVYRCHVMCSMCHMSMYYVSSFTRTLTNIYQFSV